MRILVHVRLNLLKYCQLSAMPNYRGRYRSLNVWQYQQHESGTVGYDAFMLHNVSFC